MSLLRLTRPNILTRQPTLLRTFLTTSPLRSSSQPSSAVLSSLQPDLKTALRSKDKPRLTVLRSILAEITNASKTSKPINSDAHLFTLLGKQIRASNTAVDEFQAAKRDDLVEKEKGQLAVLEDYKGRIDAVGEEEVESVVRSVVSQLGDKAAIGPVTGKAMGQFAGQPVDAEVVKRKVEEILGARS